MSLGRYLARVVFLVFLLSGCTIGRVYMGSEIREDPAHSIVIGSTTKSDVLERFGPPDGIQSQYDGDVFVYGYLRKNSASLRIEEPVITNLTFFTYTRIQQKKDVLVILFDKEGTVKNYGFYRGTTELKPY
jgi:outer membrane protein assembly factor BamE (lipoprotein component of BamABCDE complex)